MTLWPLAGCQEAEFGKDLLRGLDFVQGLAGDGVRKQGIGYKEAQDWILLGIGQLSD